MQRTHSHPEGWPKTYINHPDGTQIIFTGDRPVMVELVARDDVGTIHVHDVSRLFDHYRTHDETVAGWLAALAAGEAMENAS